MCLAELRGRLSLNARNSCPFKTCATRWAKIGPRDMSSVSLRITVSIKKITVFQGSSLDPSSSLLSPVLRIKKSLKLFSLSFLFNIDFTVEMAPKTKHVVSSSSAVAPEVQIGGPSTHEALILGNKTI